MKIKANKKRYGLRLEEIKALRLPKVAKKHSKGEVVLTVDQIFHPKSNFSILE